MITKEHLQGLVDFAAHEQLVTRTVARATRTPKSVVVFLSRYASWNGYFGSAVATLAGKIGRSRRLFLDPTEPVEALADRSVYVGSYFFDAARDEFDDRDTVHRDTHRCLAQASLLGTLNFFAEKQASFRKAAWLNQTLEIPAWLAELNRRVASGYGASSADTLPKIAQAMGYHLGSELLADREFSIIDQSLKAQLPELVASLRKQKVRIGRQEHVAYQWISIHSGEGSAVEADHFEWATKGARRALDCLPPASHPRVMKQIETGFRKFADDHRTFFENALTPNP